MDRKARLTNEQLSKKYANQYDLVNYAISLAENMIKSGRDGRVKTNTQNRAEQVLAEIVTGKDYFEEIERREVFSAKQPEDLQVKQEAPDNTLAV